MLLNIPLVEFIKLLYFNGNSIYNIINDLISVVLHEFI